MLNPTNLDELRHVFLMPSRWDSRIPAPNGMPTLCPGLIEHLKIDVGWADVEFDNLEEYWNFRTALTNVSLALPAPEASLLDWYAGIMTRYPTVYRGANFVLTIIFTNTNVSCNL